MIRRFCYVVVFCWGALLFSNTVDGVAATVQGEVILKSQVWEGVRFFAASQNVNLYNNEEELNLLYEDVLNGLIDNLVLFDLASKDTSLYVDELMLEERLQEELNRQVGLVGSVSALEQYYGEPLSRVRAKVRKEMRRSFLVEQYQSTLFPFVMPSPNDVRSFYEKNKDSLPFLGSRVDVSVLEWKISVEKEKQDSLVALLNDVRSRFLLGENFGDLVLSFSDDLGSKQNGGSLGYTSRGTLFPEYESIAYELKEGEVSKPFRSPIGFHIVLLEKRLGEKIKSSHIFKKVGLSEKDVEESLKFFKSFVGEFNVYNSVGSFDSLCVHHNPSSAAYQGVFREVSYSSLPDFLSNLPLDSLGFSSFIVNGENIYLCRFSKSYPAGQASFEGAYSDLYLLTQNNLLTDKISSLINNHKKNLHIKKFY